MSGAQPKAADIAGAVSVTAEVDASRIETRHEQGWVGRVSPDLAEIERWMREGLAKREPLSIAYHGNVVDLLEYAEAHAWPAELLSDQTSCHAAYEGGYCPAGLTYDQAKALLKEDFPAFKAKVHESLKRHYAVLRRLTDRGARFWDYGNSFLKAVLDAGVTEIAKNGRDTNDGFIWPSYVEDIMGPLCFDYGYGPFRWVCLSGRPDDLDKTDAAAASCIDPARRSQDRDNYHWVKDAKKNRLVVGTQARILYADAEGRVKIALKFNDMVRRGEIGPVIMGRDHHDVQGTDSPFRETANIYDGSAYASDMAHQCWAGNVARGMTYAVLSNGGGVGTGKCFNGGFGLLLDGSERTAAVSGSVAVSAGRYAPADRWPAAPSASGSGGSPVEPRPGRSSEPGACARRLACRPASRTAIVLSQGASAGWGSKRSIARNAARKVSCTTSSARSGSPVRRYARLRSRDRCWCTSSAYAASDPSLQRRTSSCSLQTLSPTRPPRDPRAGSVRSRESDRWARAGWSTRVSARHATGSLPHRWPLTLPLPIGAPETGPWSRTVSGPPLLSPGLMKRA